MFEFLKLEDTVLNELREMSVHEEKDAVVFLELYKYLTREELLAQLAEKAPKLDFANVQTVKRKQLYARVEQKYNVIVSELSDNDVEIVVDYYRGVDVDCLLIDSVFNLKNITVTYITPVNYAELTNREMHCTDSLAVFRRYLF